MVVLIRIKKKNPQIYDVLPKSTEKHNHITFS